VSRHASPFILRAGWRLSVHRKVQLSHAQAQCSHGVHTLTNTLPLTVEKTGLLSPFILERSRRRLTTSCDAKVLSKAYWHATS